MAIRPVKLKLVTRFPANIVGTDGITVEQSGGTVTVSINPDEVPGVLGLQAADGDLQALADNDDNGFWVRTAEGAGAARTITGTTDEITVTNGDGVSANPVIGLSPFTNEGTGAADRTIRSRLADTIHAADFGVVSDGATDDLANLQAALDEAAARGAAYVLLPPGTTAINVTSTALGVSENVALKGHGKYATTIKVLATYNANAIELADGASLTDLTVDGGDFNPVGQTNSLVAAILVSNVAIERCNLIKIGKIGIAGNGVTGIRICDNTIRRTTATGTILNQSISFFASFQNTEAWIVNNEVYNSGFDLSGSHLHVISNTIDGCKFGAAIALEGDTFTHDCSVIDNKCINMSGTDFLGTIVEGFQLWGIRHRVIGNIAKDGGGAGYHIACSHSIVDGNIAETVSQDGFTARYEDATYNASSTVFSNNIARNCSVYGYNENSASLTGIVLRGNKFSGSSGAINILSTTTTIEPILSASAGVGLTDNAAARVDGTTGYSLQGSALVIADTTGDLSRSGGGGIDVQGTNTNDSGAAGEKGEFVSSTIASGSAVSLTNNTWANVTSISLTAGDWDVRGAVAFHGSGTTQFAFAYGSISTSSANGSTAPAASGNTGAQISYANAGSVNNTNADDTVAIETTRISLNATTTVYLEGYASFTVSTCTAYGYISARRVR